MSRISLQSALRLCRLTPVYSQMLSSARRPICLNSIALNSEKPNENVKAEADKSPADSESQQKLSAELENLTTEIKSLTEKNTELLDKYRRALADGENIRKSLTKQIENAKLFGIQGFCKDLLEVADVLGYATEAVPKSELATNAALKNLYEGLSMTKGTLDQVFKRHGLEVVNPQNEKFNPNFHEALFQKDSDAAPNTVVEVTKIGYKLHERCLRPALVGVSKC